MYITKTNAYKISSNCIVNINISNTRTIYQHVLFVTVYYSKFIVCEHQIYILKLFLPYNIC